jgi:hypothetical protein
MILAMAETGQAPLPPETKVALGALILLALQEVHEGYLYCVGNRSSTIGKDGAVYLLILPLIFAVLIGLLNRGRIAWWVGVWLMGGLGLVHLVLYWPSIRASWPGHRDASERIPSTVEYEWILPSARLKPFELLWVVTKIVLLLAVPLFLNLARLRTRLRAP